MKSLRIQNLAKPNGFSNVVRVEQNRALLYVSGQGPTDEKGRTVGVGNFEAQVVQAFENLGKCLKGANASFQNIIKLTIFVVPMQDFQLVRQIRRRYLDPENLPAITSVGVTSLVNKDWLIEIEAVAEV